jgi:hypothetical protein
MRYPTDFYLFAVTGSLSPDHEDRVYKLRALY